MRRALSPFILKDLDRKIVILSGPRQTGKTTLARTLPLGHDYLNFDHPEHRLILKERSWDRKKPLLILDEVHKMDGWKSWLKGIFDVEGIPPRYLVAGSARLETLKKTGDSLAGRFFSYHLHPFDIKETTAEFPPNEAYDRLSQFGGFPEPFLENSPSFYGKWSKSHIDAIVRGDLLDLEPVRNIRKIELLIELLRTRTGSPVSTASLARDLEADAKSVRHWLDLLEALYVIFPVRPWHRNVARAILKEPKYYFFDTGLVKGDAGVKLENITACALVKELDFLGDTEGMRCSLHYIRDKENREIDFFVLAGKHACLIETKHSDDAPSPHFGIFRKVFPKCRMLQLVKELKREKTFPNGLEIRRAPDWLATVNLSGQA